MRRGAANGSRSGPGKRIDRLKPIKISSSSIAGPAIRAASPHDGIPVAGQAGRRVDGQRHRARANPFGIERDSTPAVWAVVTEQRTIPRGSPPACDRVCRAHAVCGVRPPSPRSIGIPYTDVLFSGSSPLKETIFRRAESLFPTTRSCNTLVRAWSVSSSIHLGVLLATAPPREGQVGARTIVSLSASLTLFATAASAARTGGPNRSARLWYRRAPENRSDVLTAGADFDRSTEIGSTRSQHVFGVSRDCHQVSTRTSHRNAA